VIRTMFECPETGEPLESTMAVGRWPAGDGEAVARHCPKCGSLHRFELSDAILQIDPEPSGAVGGRLTEVRRAPALPAGR
jgi:hypothetical protein